jgi:sirohydrochlorin ferrochelatase
VTGIAVFGHGSSVETANQAVRDFTVALGQRGGFALIEPSFLELGQPDLPEAVRRLVEKGATRIVVIPYFLTLGIHLKRDLPRIVDGLRAIYIGVGFEIAEPMDGHPALVEVLLDRARDVLNGGGDSASAAD